MSDVVNVEAEQQSVFRRAFALSPYAKIVVVSGGYDPITPGHISNFQAAKRIVREMGFHVYLVVIINGDQFLINKKGAAFMPLADRMTIVCNIKGVDDVFPWEGNTVDGALELLRPHFFAKGKDRKDINSIPEWETCRKIGCQILVGVGGVIRNSSDYLTQWTNRNR